MVVCVGCHLPPYPCSRLPFNTNHTQWPLEKAQCLLDLRRIPTPPQESPDSGAPRRPNQNQSHRCSPCGCSVDLPDSQGLGGLSVGRARLRRAPGRPPSEWPPASRKCSRPVPAWACGDASQRENGGMPPRLRCAPNPPPLEALPQAVRGRRANPGAPDADQRLLSRLNPRNRAKWVTVPPVLVVVPLPPLVPLPALPLTKTVTTFPFAYAQSRSRFSGH